MEQLRPQARGAEPYRPGDSLRGSRGGSPDGAGIGEGRVITITPASPASPVSPAVRDAVRPDPVGGRPREVIRPVPEVGIVRGGSDGGGRVGPAEPIPSITVVPGEPADGGAGTGTR